MNYSEMPHMSSSKLQNFSPFHRHIYQTRLTCFENRRYLLLLTLILSTIVMFQLISSTSKEVHRTDITDICSQLVNILYNNNRTLCSSEADRRGNKQYVIAMSVFGPKENPIFADDKFVQLISPLMDEATLLFPTWTIRLYADESAIQRLNLHNLSRVHTNIDICNVNRLPVLGNVGEYLAGKLWRFLPALDPMVDMASSRDLDSPLTHREQVVMEQFINSSHLFLALRDHPFHDVPILGGLWTAALHRDRLLFLRLFSILLDKIQVQRYTAKRDQTLLSELIWPKVKNQTLVFDSYTCRMFPHGEQRPFPTQRSSRECHVGCVRPCCQNSSAIALDKPCPKQCRPKNHPDWIYC